jgi:RIO kinase 1
VTHPAVFDSQTTAGSSPAFLFNPVWFIQEKIMRISLNMLDAEDIEVQNFEKIRNNKKFKLKGKQSVQQLVFGADPQLDPRKKFTNSDLNELSKLGLLDELVGGIKTGKEASVYLGKNSDGFVAVKVYTDLRVRSFKRDGSYREGRWIGDARVEKAIEQGSQRGLDLHQMLWVQEEFMQMRHFYKQGVIVPRPIAVYGITLIMEFIGDENGDPAPRISDLKMEKDEAQEAFRQSVQNLRRIVKSGRVHGDYSAYNILWYNGKAVVIDFPQVIEFINNPNANAFLERDVHSLCKTFRKQGVAADEFKVLREIRQSHYD